MVVFRNYIPAAQTRAFCYIFARMFDWLFLLWGEKEELTLEFPNVASVVILHKRPTKFMCPLSVM